MNACDACSPGGNITVAADRDPDKSLGVEAVRIVIADNGCGIPADDVVRVFDPFFTTKKRGQGTGLGLAIVMRIVRNHGARIALTSEPGKGTAATLIWPTVVDAHEVRLAG
jgi:two-component system, NtrC family, sensor histidine kinase HydH